VRLAEVKSLWQSHFDAFGDVTSSAMTLYEREVDRNGWRSSVGGGFATFAPFTGHEVRIRTGDHLLAGTVLMPLGSGPFPAVVFASGSAPDVRDSGYARYLAEHLAKKGIASLRMDDRGVGKSSPLEDRTWEDVSMEERAADLKAGVEFLRGFVAPRDGARIQPDKVALIGHSEGGQTAPALAVNDPGIAALVIMSGPGFRGAEGLRDQYQARKAMLDELLKKTVDPEERARRESKRHLASLVVEASNAIVTGDPKAQQLLETLPLWWRTTLTEDPRVNASQVKRPTLVLHGTEDFQIPLAEGRALFEALRLGNPNVTMKEYAGLSHHFAKPELDPDISPKPDALEPTVAKDVVDFLVGLLFK
jgi:uncharacterized protein